MPASAPRIIWADADAAVPAQGETDPVELGRARVRDHAGPLGATPADADTLRVRNVLDTGRGGIVVVFEQWVGERRVEARGPRVLMRRDGAMVAATGTLHPTDLVVDDGVVSEIDAARAALARAVGAAPGAAGAVSQGADGAAHVSFEPWTVDGEAVRLIHPIRVRDALGLRRRRRVTRT